MQIAEFLQNIHFRISFIAPPDPKTEAAKQNTLLCGSTLNTYHQQNPMNTTGIMRIFFYLGSISALLDIAILARKSG